METKEEKRKERVYDLVNGLLNVKDYPVEESKIVRNEFEEGCYCATKYHEVLEAYLRLCRRLKVEELNDDDVEIVINNLLDIMQHIGMKMYEYGAYFTRQELQE